MADTTLTPTGLTQIEVGASEDTWGTKLNSNASTLNGMYDDVGGQPALKVANGGTGSTTASGARSNLGLGSMATQAAAGVAITGGSVTGITDLTVADGGTGSSTASGARTNLGLGTAATQNTGTSGANVPLLNGTNTWSGAQTVSASSAGLEGVIVRATAAAATNNSASFTGYPAGAGGRGIYSTALEDATGNNVRLDLYAAGAGSAILAASLSSSRVLTLPGYGAGTLSTNSSGVVSSSSDERLKDVVAPFTRGLADLKAMSGPVFYLWKAEQAAIIQARANLRSLEHAVAEATAREELAVKAVETAKGVKARRGLQSKADSATAIRDREARALAAAQRLAALDLEEAYVGWTAQGVQRAIPEAVDTDPNGLLTLDDRPILAAVVNAVKELSAANDSLREDNVRLFDRLTRLERGATR